MITALSFSALEVSKERLRDVIGYLKECRGFNKYTIYSLFVIHVSKYKNSYKESRIVERAMTEVFELERDDVLINCGFSSELTKALSMLYEEEV